MFSCVYPLLHWILLGCKFGLNPREQLRRNNRLEGVAVRQPQLGSNMQLSCSKFYGVRPRALQPMYLGHQQILNRGVTSSPTSVR
jgi:hypothetical protein